MCGIAGIINYKIEKPFDYPSICTLGIANDSRGGDSCGVFIDGKVEYGVKNEKYFEDFFEDSKLLTTTTMSRVALVHCRKASIGKVSIETAQPVVITDPEGNVKFVMLHNGTIHNYEDLAKKYIPDIQIKDMTDSQVMARIFFYKGYDVLTEYNGGSVFFIVDYRQPDPKFLMFKGASKKSEYSKEITEERPFYFTMDGRDEMMFSSIRSYLAALRPGRTVYTISPNSLIEFTGDNIVIVKTYDRSECCQTKIYKNNYSYGGSAYTTVYGKGKSSGSTGSGSYSGGVSTYLNTEEELNVYNAGGKRAHGKYFVTKYGTIKQVFGKDTYEVWFFQGVALKGGEKYFSSLEALCKKLNIKPEEFYTKFQVLLRFYSLDQLFFLEGKLVKAISIRNYELYSGTYQMLGKTYYSTYKSGDKSSIVTEKGAYETPFRRIRKWETIGKLNKLYKKCMSSTK